MTKNAVENRPYRSAFLRLYLSLTLFLIADIIVQVFLAGAGIFASGEFLVWHGYHSWLLDLVVFLLLICGLLARLPRSLTWLTLCVFLFVFVQAGLIHASRDFHVPMVSALHPVFALFSFTLSCYLWFQVQRLHKNQAFIDVDIAKR